MGPAAYGSQRHISHRKACRRTLYTLVLFLLAGSTSTHISSGTASTDPNAQMSSDASPLTVPQQRNTLRVRREVRATESLLTVEWEGIQSGDHPDSSIKGFIVEYRAEKDDQWNVHSGVIPYKGPNHQYRVQKKPAKMMIKVKTLTGKELQVVIEPQNTVKQIKEKIEEQEGIPPTQQRLIFNGKQMQPDDKKAQDLNVIEGSTVHMVLALRGGGSSIVSEEESRR